MAMDIESDVVFFVDQDMVIPPHAVVALMARDLPIVSGYYVSRRPPYLPQMYKIEHGEAPPGMGARVTPRHVYWPIVDYPEEPVLFEVDAVGAGCLMVKREVFEHLASLQEVHDRLLDIIMRRLRAHPASPGNPEGITADEYDLLHEHVRVMNPWFEFLNDEGEDMYFSRKARAAGYKIFVDLSVKCSHIGNVPIEEGHFLYVKPHLRKEGKTVELANDTSASG